MTILPVDIYNMIFLVNLGKMINKIVLNMLIFSNTTHLLRT